jgi:hypothetical protein
MTEETLKTEMIRHIKAHNTRFYENYLEAIPVDVLMYEVHPLYREYYEKQLKEIRK